MDRRFAALPGWLRAAVTLALWVVRACVALFVAFWTAVIVTVTGEALRGLPSETENAELAAVGLVLLGMSPVLWWWLGRRRLLATPEPSALVSDDLRVRKSALVDLYWLTAKGVAFAILAFVVSVGVAVLVAAVGEARSGSDPLESDRVMTLVLLSGTILTGCLWWTWRRVAGGDGSDAGQGDQGAASPNETGPVR